MLGFVAALLLQIAPQGDIYQRLGDGLAADRAARAQQQQAERAQQLDEQKFRFQQQQALAAQRQQQPDDAGSQASVQIGHLLKEKRCEEALSFALDHGYLALAKLAKEYCAPP